MESEFPGNSKAKKKAPLEHVDKRPEKNVKPILTGEAKTRKKPLRKRFLENFISGADSKSVLEYVTFDIVVPYAKDMFLDALNAGFERKFYGEVRSRGRRGYGGSSGGNGIFTAYNQMSKQQSPYGSSDGRSNISRRARANHNFGEIIIPTRPEATEVLEGLYLLVNQYDAATVADLYDMCNISSTFMDSQWGWTNLQGSDVVRVREGYLLELPRPEYLE
jgi:hypothetical protein